MCITDIEVLDELKAQELEKAEVEAVKKVKQLEREQKRLRKEENRKAKEKQKKIKGRQSLKSSQTKPASKKSKPKTALRKQATRKGRSLSGMASRLPFVTVSRRLMKMMLSVLSVERYLQMMRMVFG